MKISPRDHQVKDFLGFTPQKYQICSMHSHYQVIKKKLKRKTIKILL